MTRCRSMRMREFVCGSTLGAFHALGERIPVVAGGVAEKSALFEMLQRASAVPRSLAFDAKHHTIGVGPHARRAAEAAADRNRLPLGRDLQAPAAKELPRVIRPGQPQHHPDVPLGVVLRPERKLMPFGVAPGVAERFVAIGCAVLVGVGQLRHFAELRDVDIAVFFREAENLILPAGEQVVLRRGNSSNAPSMK